LARVFLGVGSNEGDRLRHISRAAKALGAAGIRVVQMAMISETKPVGLPAPRPLQGIFYVYAIRCENSSIYIGQTDDLERRWKEHQNGRIDWTSRYRPVEIAHFEVLSTREEALRREQKLKTSYGRKWLRKLIESGKARQAGGPPQDPYLNTVIEADTTLEPAQLLAALKALEAAAGRKPSAERWSPRPLDLDILLYDDRIVQTPQLAIPHPRLHERQFVLEPLAQLAPEVSHPVLHETIGALRDRLREAAE